MKKHIANILTLCRVFGSILLLCIPVFSAGFNTVYILCGFSDMIDGTVARKIGSAGKFGAKLDSVADIMFMAAAFFKLLPVMPIHWWLWVWTAAIAGVRTINGVIGKNLLMPHTFPNKLTGFMLFLLPLTIKFIDIRYSGTAVCCAATYAALHDCYCTRKSGL
jgi:CDP-diacylglycerol--glycerol-3-phosphate 3-phosphatidyltransferase